jgi:hypothetical protein
MFAHKNFSKNSIYQEQDYFPYILNSKYAGFNHILDLFRFWGHPRGASPHITLPTGRIYSPTDPGPVVHRQGGANELLAEQVGR